MSNMFRRSKRSEESNGPGRGIPGPVLSGMLAIGVIISAMVVWSFAVDGTSAAIRAAAEFVMPVGATWVLAFGLMIGAARGGRWGSAFLLALFVISLGLLGNVRIANRMAASVEWPSSESADRRLSEDPVRSLDAVIVLGGSLSTSVEGNFELGRDGERVLTAAQFWHAGITQQIIVTGTSVTETGPASKASAILQSVGISSDSITKIDGLNTVEEMMNLKTFFEGTETDTESVGLITSAFHLPRAMRLAKKQGLNFVPLPVAYRERDSASIAPYHVIPDVSSLKVSTLAIRETIAGLVGR